MRPHFFAAGHQAITFNGYSSRDEVHIDLGSLYWNQILDRRHLATSVANAPPNETVELPFEVQARINKSAVAEIDRVKSILGSSATRLPSAAELWYCFRVIDHCVEIASATQRGLEVHMADGLSAECFDQYSLAEIIEATEGTEGTEGTVTTDVGEIIGELLAKTNEVLANSDVAVIAPRDDGELIQAFMIARLLKQRPNAPTVILDGSGASEQVGLGEWQGVFSTMPAQVSRHIDYFLPWRDYGATLERLLAALRSDPMRASPQPLSPPTAEDVNDAFSAYTQTLPLSHVANRRTIVGRLLPSTGARGADDDAPHDRAHVSNLMETIEQHEAESLVLTDEALHPKTLLAFARALLDSDLSLIYRARCRFTNDLTEEACQVLYKSGCRCLEMGLLREHMGATVDHDGVLINLEQADIRVHIYTILGFPNETRDEIAQMRDFLIDNIDRCRYLTVGVSRFQPSIDDEIRDIVETSIHHIYQAEFLPDIEDPATEMFGRFIDDLGLFHAQKTELSHNPYHDLAIRRTEPYPVDLGQYHYTPSMLFWLAEAEDTSIICDWVTFNYTCICTWQKEFILSFDPRISLKENTVRLQEPKQREEFHELFGDFLRLGFFHQDTEAPNPVLTRSSLASIWRKVN